MNAPTGLRERKKEQTRRLIAETARRLFAERGFDAVTVAAVASAADVAPKTVFNYFPTKEDLFYSRLEEFEEGMLAAVRERDRGESVLAAFRDFLLGQGGVLAMGEAHDEEATRQLRTVTRVITESPALLARERQVISRYEEALAALIADEVGARPDAVEPRAVANALLGLHRALIAYVRDRVAAGERASQIRRGVRTQAKRAFAQIESGLGEYAAKGR